MVAWAIQAFPFVAKVGGTIGRGGSSAYKVVAQVYTAAKKANQVCNWAKNSSNTGPKNPKGTRDPHIKEACRRRQEAHKEFAEKIKSMEEQGWKSESRILGKDGRWHRPDAT